MRFVLEPDADGFAAPDRGLSWIEGDAVLNTLPATIARSRLAGLNAGDTGPPLWITVESGPGKVIGAAVRTPPRAFVLAAVDPPVAAALADFVAGAGLTRDLPGVNGPVGPAAAFADRWSELTGCGVSTETNMRLYRLDHLKPPDGVPGRWRMATRDDFDLCMKWFTDFQVDAHLDPRGARPPEPDDVMARIDDARMGLWELAAVPVSLAGWTLPAAGVVRVGPVFTPREHRRHGYGAAATAAATADIVAQGARACLFTDLANPTSNSIYQKIGYRPVADFVELVFH